MSTKKTAAQGAPVKKVEATKAPAVKAKAETVVKTPVAKKVETVESPKAAPGRPTNPTSRRQQELKEREAKRAAGLIKKGRPVLSGSNRQLVLQARSEKLANGGELKKGRPVNPLSSRQMRLNKKQAVGEFSNFRHTEEEVKGFEQGFDKGVESTIESVTTQE